MHWSWMRKKAEWNSLFPKLGYRKISSLRLIRRSKEFAKEILGFQSSGRRSGLSSDSELLDSEDGEIDWEREPIRRKKKDGMRIVRLIIGFPHHQKGDAVSIANYLTGWRAPQLKDEEWIPFGKEDRNLSRHHLFSRLLGQTMWLLRHLLLSWGSFRTSALVDSLLSTKLRFFYLMNE